MQAAYDAIVIGSGFGGAISAFRLAQAGQSVALFEQGRRYAKQDFPRTVGQVGRAFFRPGEPTGFLEYRAFRNIDVIQGAGVGGGSLHYFNVNVRAPARVLDRWPKPLGRTCLDPYYAVALERLDSKPLEVPTGRDLPRRTRAFIAAAREVKAAPSLADLAVYTGPDRVNAAGVAQSACTHCGNCMLGCHLHAKNTLDITYIAAAERDHGLELFAEHKVVNIRPATQKGEGYHVDFEPLGAGGAPPAKGSVYARRVVVAAGTLGSTELLLRCRDVTRSLPRLSRALGSRFSGNGDFLFAGALGGSELIDPAAGPSITAIADFSTAEHDIHIEDLGFPDPMFWFLEAALPPSSGRTFGTLRAGARYLMRSLGFQCVGSRLSDEVGSLLRGGRTNYFLPYLGMGSDAADGQLRLKDGSIDVQWSHQKSLPMFREMERAMRKLSQARGARYVTSFLWKWPTRKLLTAHPLGGCVIGHSEHDSVVNHRGEVWNYPGLYVTDGAAVPSALSVNPSLTIAALAERAAFLMLHDRERRASDPA
jgi:cholesterol oxidase